MLQIVVLNLVHILPDVLLGVQVEEEGGVLNFTQGWLPDLQLHIGFRGFAHHELMLLDLLDERSEELFLALLIDKVFISENC